MGQELLRKQLERVRFEKAIDYITVNSHGRKHLNAQELAQINNLMTSSEGDPWRTEPLSMQLRTGGRASFGVISNPMTDLRNVISNAQTKAANGEVEEAATYLYSEIVLKHFFKDANRRTAVVATYWLLLEHSIEIPPVGLLEIGLGDLRTKDQVESLRGLIKLTIQISKSRKP